MASNSSLANPSVTRDVLEEHGLSAKYSLGQNFLVNDAILGKIVALADVQETDHVLEVGPGIGTLTMALLKHAGHVTSVERDPDLPAVLADTLAPWRATLSLVRKDALDLSQADIEGAPGLRGPGDGCAFGNAPALPNKLVANLPYAVAATVVLDYFERFESLGSATVMVQKEVADRMAARPGTKSYGAYTVKLRLFAEPEDRFPVGPANFFPQPRVDSAVIRLNRRPLAGADGAPLDAEGLRAACAMADAAFCNRRKTLANSCKAYFASRGAQGAGVSAQLPTLFERAGIDPRRRGETLELEEFVRLGAALQALEG